MKIALKTHVYQAVGPHATYLLVLAATIGAGCVAYVLVERPLLTYLQARHKRGAPRPRLSQPVSRPPERGHSSFPRKRGRT